MNIIINKTKTLKVLQKIIGGSDKNNNNLMLANVLFFVSGQTLSLTCSNIEMEIQSSFKVQYLGEDFLFSVNVLKIYNIFRLLGDEEVLLIYNPQKGSIQVEVKKTKFSLNAMEGESFPKFEDLGESRTLTVQGVGFLSVLKKTQNCIANRDFRVFLNGLLFHVKQDQIISVSSDSHRLAYAQCSIESTLDKKIIIPKRSIIEILKIFELEEALESQVVISFYDLFLEVKIKETVFKTKLINEQFPEYLGLVNKEYPIQIQFKQKEFYQHLKIITSILDEKRKTIIFEINGNKVFLKSHQISSEEECSETSIPLEKTLPFFKIALNGQYLLDLIRDINEEEIYFGFIDEKSSCLVSGKNPQLYRYVIMPVKI